MKVLVPSVILGKAAIVKLIGVFANAVNCCNVPCKTEVKPPKVVSRLTIFCDNLERLKPVEASELILSKLTTSGLTLSCRFTKSVINCSADSAAVL